jgi:hypothetical protein
MLDELLLYDTHPTIGMGEEARSNSSILCSTTGFEQLEPKLLQNLL